MLKPITPPSRTTSRWLARWPGTRWNQRADALGRRHRFARRRHLGGHEPGRRPLEVEELRRVVDAALRRYTTASSSIERPASRPCSRAVYHSCSSRRAPSGVVTFAQSPAAHTSAAVVRSASSVSTPPFAASATALPARKPVRGTTPIAATTRSAAAAPPTPSSLRRQGPASRRARGRRCRARPPAPTAPSRTSMPWRRRCSATIAASRGSSATGNGQRSLHHERHVQAAVVQDLGHLDADQPAADHDRALAGLGVAVERLEVAAASRSSAAPGPRSPARAPAVRSTPRPAAAGRRRDASRPRRRARAPLRRASARGRARARSASARRARGRRARCRAASSARRTRT